MGKADVDNSRAHHIVYKRQADTVDQLSDFGKEYIESEIVFLPAFLSHRTIINFVRMANLLDYMPAKCYQAHILKLLLMFNFSFPHFSTTHTR